MAAACADTGLRVALVDPKPHRVWPHTYASWLDELPAHLPKSALSSVMERMHTYGTAHHLADRAYAVLDNQALHEQLRRDDVTEVRGKAVAAEHGPTGSTVVLKDGRRIATATVIDATGATRALSGGRPNRAAAAQTAVGAVVDARRAEHLCPGGSGVFMDWRPPSRAPGDWPTFLYAVRLDPDRVLLEETCLARRPALPLAVLRRRLRARLEDAGIAEDDKLSEERVRFPVDDPLPRAGRVVPFGAAAGFVHPATGFSVASSLHCATWVAAAVRGGLRSDPAAASRAAWSVLWPARALASQNLRRRALEGLLSLPAHRVPELFDAFFTMDRRQQAAFLASDSDPGRMAAAMTSLFRVSPWRVRARLVGGGLSPRRTRAEGGLTSL